MTSFETYFDAYVNLMRGGMNAQRACVCVDRSGLQQHGTIRDPKAEKVRICIQYIIKYIKSIDLHLYIIKKKNKEVIPSSWRNAFLGATLLRAHTHTHTHAGPPSIHHTAANHKTNHGPSHTEHKGTHILP